MAPRDKTACQTFPCKCKICISSIESDVYNKKKIQMFVVNMTFISSREVKKCIFHSCLRHSWNTHFFTSLDEIKVIFTPNIWISSIYYLSLSLSLYDWSSIEPWDTTEDVATMLLHLSQSSAQRCAWRTTYWHNYEGNIVPCWVTPYTVDSRYLELAYLE